jgi:hypothetical protein
MQVKRKSVSARSLKCQGLANGQRIPGLRLWKIAASGEPRMMANARCLRMMIAAIIAVAVPAAIGIDRNRKSIATPVMLPAAANINHFRCLPFIRLLSSAAPGRFV